MNEIEQKINRTSGIAVAGRERGIMLIIVLWIMMLLIVMTLAFSVTVRTEAFSTLTFRDQLENKYLAEAGLERAMLEILYRNANKTTAAENNARSVIPIDGTTREGALEDGRYRLALTDEGGKININLLTDASGIILNNLLVNLGVEKEQADTIVDSVLDWKDTDDLHRLHGAESNYYMGLPNPYKARDANFDNLEELLLVRGMTQDILYGTGEKPGLIRFLTVYTSADRINIQAARPEVLAAIPGMTDEIVQAVITYRRSDNTRKDGPDLQSLVSAANFASMTQYVTTTDSNVYSVEVIGFKPERTGGYPLKAVLVAGGMDRCRIAFYQSPAHMEIPRDDALQERLQ
ncbi:MAG: hypothetical protein EG826_11410 [Deltaproteobacteria bacterium]|nr:hypothetical protein [Deltaproteobacteria bacterium]